MQKITPFLWFDGRAEEAMNFYTSIFKNSQKGDVKYYGEGSPAAKGSVMSASFTLDGQDFIAFNGGPMFSFTPAISLFVSCPTQEEIDFMWDQLSADGHPQMCGWVTDKFGISWQIVPPVLGDMLNDKDGAKAKRVMQAMLQMKKLDLALLQQAYDGVTA